MLPPQEPVQAHYYVSYTETQIRTGFYGHHLSKEINVSKDDACRHKLDCSGECVRLRATIRPSSDRQHFDVACVLRPDGQDKMKINHTIYLQDELPSSASQVTVMSAHTGTTTAATPGPNTGRCEDKEGNGE